MPRLRCIPQFPRSAYEVSVGWRYLEGHLEEWNTDGMLRLDPDFQRGHVWTKEQQIAYVEYILRGGDVSRRIVFNSKDWDKLQSNQIELLDGKQRLEAALGFMRDEVPAFGYTRSEYADDLRFVDCRFQFQVVSLDTRAEVLDLYLKINAGGTPHTPEELDRVRAMLTQEQENG